MLSLMTPAGECIHPVYARRTILTRVGRTVIDVVVTIYSIIPSMAGTGILVVSIRAGAMYTRVGVTFIYAVATVNTSVSCITGTSIHG